MEIVPRKIRIYMTQSGYKPYEEWIDACQDKKTRGIIRRRISRLSQGNFGDCERLNTYLYELKIDYGPGYRVYFGVEDLTIVVLLCGGTKKTQKKDIGNAKKYWNELRNRADE